MIKIENLSHAYGAARILKDVSLDIPKGGVTALIGPNGAGKSTLLSLIARLEPMKSGRITVDDLEVGLSSNRDLAQKLSILPQSAELAPRLTVRELVAFGRYPYSQGRTTDADRAKITETLVSFDLTSLADRALDSLSGGQKQRAYVAMIYAQDTDYMLLDEPLNNLDIAASRSLMRLLQSLAQEKDRTIVIVLHDINYACSYANHIVAMTQGAVRAQGRPADIVTASFIKDVFATDAKVHLLDGQPVVQV